MTPGSPDLTVRSKGAATIYRYEWRRDPQTGEKRRYTVFSARQYCSSPKHFATLILSQRKLLGDLYAGSIWIQP